MKQKRFKTENCWNAFVSVLCNLSQLLFDIQHQARDKAPVYPTGIFTSTEKNNLCQTMHPHSFLLFLFGDLLLLGGVGFELF